MKSVMRMLLAGLACLVASRVVPDGSNPAAAGVKVVPDNICRGPNNFICMAMDCFPQQGSCPPPPVGPPAPYIRASRGPARTSPQCQLYFMIGCAQTDYLCSMYYWMDNGCTVPACELPTTVYGCSQGP